MNNQTMPNDNFETKARQALRHILNLRPIGGRPKDIQISESDLVLIREALGFPVDGSWDFLSNQELEQCRLKQEGV